MFKKGNYNNKKCTPKNNKLWPINYRLLHKSTHNIYIIGFRLYSQITDTYTFFLRSTPIQWSKIQYSVIMITVINISMQNKKLSKCFRIIYRYIIILKRFMFWFPKILPEPQIEKIMIFGLQSNINIAK